MENHSPTEHRSTVSARKQLPPEFLYFILGAACTVFPITLPFLPLLMITRVGGLSPLFSSGSSAGASSAASRLMNRSFRLRMVLVHLPLAIFPFFLQYDLFFRFLASGWHLTAGAFWLMYMLSYGQIYSPRRVVQFLIWSGVCFCIVSGFVLVDTYVLSGIAKESLFLQVQEQAKQLRDALFNSKISPYQLPDNIRVLLEQGPGPWAQSVIEQVVPGLFGLMMAVFFVYWNLFDARLKNPSGVLYMFFRLPDWAMLVLILWLTAVVGGYSLDKFSGQDASASGIQTFGMVGLFATLWWYALEGASLLIRQGAKIRRFWVYFGLAALFFFSIQVAEVIMMGIGLGAQIRRFMPQKTSKTKN